MATTRLSSYAIGVQPTGSFAGKVESARPPVGKLTRLGEHAIGVQRTGNFAGKEQVSPGGPHSPGQITRLGQMAIGTQRYFHRGKRKLGPVSRLGQVPVGWEAYASRFGGKSAVVRGRRSSVHRGKGVSFSKSVRDHVFRVGTIDVSIDSEDTE